MSYLGNYSVERAEKIVKYGKVLVNLPIKGAGRFLNVLYSGSIYFIRYGNNDEVCALSLLGNVHESSDMVKHSQIVGECYVVSSERKDGSEYLIEGVRYSIDKARELAQEILCYVDCDNEDFMSLEDDNTSVSIKKTEIY